ncbi:MAG: LegC family aminotransferase [Bacteroidales bacterium]|nr:LegC family aminotransferase [Bacteroidales bacterium]
MKELDPLIDFVRSQFHEPEAFIPLHDPRFIGNEKKYLEECIDSNFVSSVGEFVGKFERMCADYAGTRYAVAAMNGTAALHVALQLSGVRRDDEVITQSLTFIATANAITYTGAKPVFLDVDRETMGLSPDSVARWLSDNAEMRGDSAYNKKTGRRIAACVPMHTFGHPVKIDRLAEVLDSYGIPLIEDAAESLGSLFGGKHTGTFGKAGILSFNGNKIITTGGGGMILTDDEELAVKAKHMTTQAKIPHAWEYVHDMTGYNYRLTNINAALGCAQMETLDQFIALKRDLAFRYREFFRESEFTFFDEPEECRSNFWLNVIITKDRKRRDEVLEYTNSRGVMTRPIWELMNRLSMYRDCQTDGLENSVWFADRVVNLPSSAYIEGYGKGKTR